MKVTIPERVRTGLSFGERSARSATSGYRRIERSLTSIKAHDGWIAFVLENISIPVSFVTGLLWCLSAIAYSRYLSTQLLHCPEWAVNCQMPRYLIWNVENISTVQGSVTAVFSTGLALMLYSLRTVAESAIWPLLALESFTFDQIETYLCITRNQPFSARHALQMTRKTHTATFLYTMLLTTITSLAVAPLMGAVFAIRDVQQEFESIYRGIDGGIQMFAQTNPPVSIDADALIAYQSWSKNFSQEPMPQYRDWLIDRALLHNVGSLTAAAVHTRAQVHCRGHRVREYEVKDADTIVFRTNFVNTSSEIRNISSSDQTKVYIPKSNPSLAVWIDSVAFPTQNKSSASIILASFNETIEKGVLVQLSGGILGQSINISSILCEVEVELIDDILRTGSPEYETKTIPTLSSIADLRKPDLNSAVSQPRNPHNEFALWLAVAPVLVGSSIAGAQPTYFQSNDKFAMPVSSTEPPIKSHSWTIAEIDHFIRVSIGAVAQSAARKSSENRSIKMLITSKAETQKLIPERPVFLFIPVAVVLASGIFLMLLNAHLHHRYNVPIMRLANIVEVLKSSQTAYLSERLTVDAKDANELSDVGGVRVKFGMARGLPSPGVGADAIARAAVNMEADVNISAEDEECVAGLSLEVEPFQKVAGILMRRLRA